MQPATSSTDALERVAPPWALRGTGWMLLYRFDPQQALDSGWVPPHLTDDFRGGVGAVMLVDYTTSPVGPYRELLFIPGVSRRRRRRYHTISKIYVSTQASVVNGRENWGIPKQLADFEINPVEPNKQRFSVSLNGQMFFSALLEPGALRFPVNTLFNPFPVRLLQEHQDGRLRSVLPRAGGVISPTATLHELAIDNDAFPDVTAYQPLGVIEVVQARLTFPLPLTVS